jgi:hypothetical protein
MALDRISVECYAGARADERPRRMTISGREHLVARLLGESVEETGSGREQTRHFRVLTVEGLVLEILHAGDGDWYLESYDPASA